MSLTAQSGAHSQHALAYHLVWVTKYRRSVLTRAIGDRAKVLIRQIAEAQGCEVISVETEVDHVHVLIRLRPTHQLSNMVQRLKGSTAYALFREYPTLKNRLWGGHLWSPSYYVATVGGAPLETIKKYVESQRSK
jgi:putative transposase